jgi:hypothetical protein
MKKLADNIDEIIILIAAGLALALVIYNVINAIS